MTGSAKAISISRKWMLSFLCLASLLAGCGGPDVKITNQIKTFGPQWVSLKERMHAVEKNTDDTKGVFEKHYSEFSGNFSKVRDSTQKALVDSLQNVFHRIVKEKETLSDSIESLISQNNEVAGAFYEWEKKVMRGKISNSDASTDLRKFKETYSEISSTLKTQEENLQKTIDTHNQLFRRLAQLFNSPAHMDIVLKF